MTDTPTTDALISELRALLEKSARGPWRISQERCDVTVRRDEQIRIDAPNIGTLAIVFHNNITGKGPIDAQLIVAAVNAIPVLLAERNAEPFKEMDRERDSVVVRSYDYLATIEPYQRTRLLYTAQQLVSAFKAGAAS